MCGDFLLVKLASPFHNVLEHLRYFYSFTSLRLTKCNTGWPSGKKKVSDRFTDKSWFVVVDRIARAFQIIFFQALFLICHDVIRLYGRNVTWYFMWSAIFVSSILTSCGVMQFVVDRTVRPFQIIYFQALSMCNLNIESYRIKKK